MTLELWGATAVRDNGGLQQPVTDFKGAGKSPVSSTWKCYVSRWGCEPYDLIITHFTFVPN